jgi:GNAT superfamily N-acetyltransferase
MSVFSQSGPDPRDGASFEGTPGPGLPFAPEAALSELSTPPRASAAPRIEIDSIVEIREMLKRSPAEALLLFTETVRIYGDCFPDASERESDHSLLGRLRDPASDWRMHVALDVDGTVIGARHINVMEAWIEDRPVSFAWEEHLYVNPAPQYRRKGCGSAIVQTINDTLKDNGVGLVLSEHHDPFLMTQGEIAGDISAGIQPEQRLEFWGKLGYRALNLPYVQPTLDGGDPVFRLRLCCRVTDPTLIPAVVGFTGRSLDRDACLAMIRRFHETFVEDLERDPTSIYLKSLVDRGPRDIALIDIHEPRTFTQERIDLLT